MLMKIFIVIMDMLIIQEKKLCTWVNEESWAMMKTCFADAKQIKQYQNPLYVKNVHMFKNK